MPIFSLTKEKVISNAVTLLGVPPITSFQTGGDTARAALDAFDYLAPVAIAENDWRFATKIQALAKKIEPPYSSDWKYNYSFPSDYLTLLKVIPLSDYQIYENSIFSNNTTLSLEYRFQPAIEKWPMYFVNYFQLYLAETLCLTLAHDQKTMQIISQRRLSEMRKALYIDAQAHPSKTFQDHPLINCRW